MSVSLARTPWGWLITGATAMLLVAIVGGVVATQIPAPPCEKFAVRPVNSLVLGCLRLSAALRLGDAGHLGTTNFYNVAGELVKSGDCRAFDVMESLMACTGAFFLEIYPEREPDRRYFSPAELWFSK